MATNKPTDEKITEIDEKIAQLKKQKRRLQSKAKTEERKARTHRLIQIGASVEAYCGEITDIDAFNKYLEQYSYAIKKTQAPSHEKFTEKLEVEIPDFTEVFPLS